MTDLLLNMKTREISYPVTSKREYHLIGHIRGQGLYLKMDHKSGMITHGTMSQIKRLGHGLRGTGPRRMYTTTDMGSGWYEVR